MLLALLLFASMRPAGAFAVAVQGKAGVTMINEWQRYDTWLAGVRAAASQAK